MYINSDAELIVMAPFNTSEENINKVVSKYKDRLQKTQKEVQLRNLKFNKKEFVDGERFLYLGNYYNLKLVNNRKILLDFKDDFLLSKKYLSYAKNIFIIWYKRRAYEKISQRVEWYAQKNGFKYNIEENLKDIISDLDVLYMTRIQKERFPDPVDYERLKGVYQISTEDIKNVKDRFIILHPLPRVDEIDYSIDKTKHSRYFEQALNGVWVRMALILIYLGID